MSNYPDLSLTPSSTSYFSPSDRGLDPKLFDGSSLRSEIRESILGMLFDFLERHYHDPSRWTHVWLAGSGVSFQWDAARFPGDLDCLVGVDFTTFRENNPDYEDLGDDEIAKTINEAFNAELMPHTASWHGYELTFYVNPDSWDIRNIHPYAAYDLIHNDWTVPPVHEQAPSNPQWAFYASQDALRASEITRRYTDALTSLRGAQNPAYRLNAEVRLNAAVDQGADLYNDIHTGRRAAFSRTGNGYADWGNFRWQSGKASGVVQAMKALKDYRDAVTASNQVQTYGLELPDSSTMIRRAAERRFRP